MFYSLADVTFIGGSFQRGGHNLLEPAHFGNIIILGPDMTNFQNITDEMLQVKAALQIKTPEELATKILFFCARQNEKITDEYRDNAKKYVKSKEKILNNYLEQIDKFL